MDLKQSLCPCMSGLQVFLKPTTYKLELQVLPLNRWQVVETWRDGTRLEVSDSWRGARVMTGTIPSLPLLSTFPPLASPPHLSPPLLSCLSLFLLISSSLSFPSSHHKITTKDPSKGASQLWTDTKTTIHEIIKSPVRLLTIIQNHPKYLCKTILKNGFKI